MITSLIYIFSILSQLNYFVNTIARGESAVGYLKYNEADLQDLDMILDPGIDGLEADNEILKLNPNLHLKDNTRTAIQSPKSCCQD
jgi:CheY-like chemotaxis protein